MTLRIDRLNKLLLQHAAEAATIDFDALADAMGCRPDVARARYDRMRREGLIAGFQVRVDESQQALYELLVVGVPGDATTPDALAGLSQEAAVSRVFTLAAYASTAFLLRGSDLPALRALASRLARQVGLEQYQAILVVKQFHEDPHAGAPWRAEQTVTA